MKCHLLDRNYEKSEVIHLRGFRIAVLLIGVAAGFFALQFVQKPIQAARQDAKAAGADPGKQSYADHCAICHGDNLEGNLPAFPPLAGIGHRMTEDKLAQVIHAGVGRMPGFPDIQNGEMTALVHFLTSAVQEEQASAGGAESGEATGVVKAGGGLFHQNCAFCHGRDAMGGESGPDLTQSKLVLSDKGGDKIAEVVRTGRPAKKMPAFNFSSQEMQSIVAFIHWRVEEAASHPGGRRGVAVADLQTGNAAAGKQYFDGAGGCVKCHSATGDLAGIATRFEGLQLERRMLYPEGAESKVTVTLPSGKSYSGTLAYLDEFTVALRDAGGIYRSWSTSHLRYQVDSPVDAHVALFSKYSDDDVHNLMAYLQTLK